MLKFRLVKHTGQINDVICL